MIVAVVMVLQRIEGLSDREAVERFTFDARWKYAAGGLDFDYPGFVHTVLVDMRARLARSERPDRIFQVVLEVARQAGLVGRQRVLDSTPIELDPVARTPDLWHPVATRKDVRPCLCPSRPSSDSARSSWPAPATNPWATWPPNSESAARCLQNWIRQDKADAGDSSSGLSSAEKKELAELCKRNRQLEMENDVLKRAAA